MPPKRATKPTAKSKGKARASSPSKSSISSRIASRQRHAHNDAEIRESFSLFAVRRDQLNEEELQEAGNEDDEEDEEGWIRVADVRRCLSAINLPRPPPDFFDPDETLVSWNDFKELARTLRDVDAEAEDEDEEADVDMHENEGEEELEEEQPRKVRGKGKAKAKGKSKQSTQEAEIDHAFTLFTTPVQQLGKASASDSNGQGGRNITLADLKRVARELREDVDERVLRMMIEEANGETGSNGLAKGVGKDEFEGVMRRAGVFG